MAMMGPHDFRTIQEEIEHSSPSSIKSPDAFVAINYDFFFLYLNHQAEKFYGKKRRELLGRTIEDAFPELWNFGPFKNARQSVSTRKEVEIQYNAPLTSDWVQLIGRPFENYYTLTYRIIDYKEVLKKELRQQFRKKK